jgi:hypothetical protein
VPEIVFALPPKAHVPLVQLMVPLFTKLPLTVEVTLAVTLTVPPTVTSVKVLAPVLLIVVVPLKVTKALDVNAPVPAKLFARVASAPALAVNEPGLVTVNAPATLNGVLLAVKAEPAPVTVIPAVAVNPALAVNVDAFTVNKPFVVNPMEEVTVAPPLAVTANKVVDTGVPLKEVAPFKVKVPEVRLIVPLFTILAPEKVIVFAADPVFVKVPFTVTDPEAAKSVPVPLFMLNVTPGLIVIEPVACTVVWSMVMGVVTVTGLLMVMDVEFAEVGVANAGTPLLSQVAVWLQSPSTPVVV